MNNLFDNGMMRNNLAITLNVLNSLTTDSYFYFLKVKFNMHSKRQIFWLIYSMFSLIKNYYSNKILQRIANTIYNMSLIIDSL